MKASQSLSYLIALIASSVLAGDAVQKGGSILIKPGDSLVVQFERAGDKLVNPRVVEKMISDHPCIRLQCASNIKDAKAQPAKPDALLTFMLGDNPNMTILLVQKNISEHVAYDCFIKASGSGQFERRNNLVLEQNLPMFEQYPEKLEAIKLNAFRSTK